MFARVFERFGQRNAGGRQEIKIINMLLRSMLKSFAMPVLVVVVVVVVVAVVAVVVLPPPPLLSTAPQVAS